MVLYRTNINIQPLRHLAPTDSHLIRFAEKQKKLAMKIKAEEEASRASGSVSAGTDAGLDGADKIPTNIEDREKYFMDQLQSGEILYRKGRRGRRGYPMVAVLQAAVTHFRTMLGPAHFQAAASCFMKAMKAYPQPLELIGLFQKSLPDPVFQILMEMMAAEVRKEEEQENARREEDATSGGRRRQSGRQATSSSSPSPNREDPTGRKSSIPNTQARARRDEARRATEAAAVADLLQELMGDDNDEWEDEEDGGNGGGDIEVLE